MPGQASPEPVFPDGTPERLGRYRLVRPISTGGMARVFEGRRESLAGVSPRVAIKVILPDFATDAGFRQLFVNEARIGSMLQHPNLVQIQDFDYEKGHYYLVMEYVEGFTLRRAVNLCRRNGIFIPLSIVAEIGRQVCDGLHYAHTARGEDGAPLHLVHRDIKPSNLMINPQGLVKVLDFGVSRTWIARERFGAVRGTWGYMAPEQAAGAGELRAQADLYGLAAVLYELCMLQPLFSERDNEEIKRLMAADEGARRAARLSGPHGPLAGVLVRALQRDPEARFASAAEMGRALAALVADPVTAREQLVHFQRTVAGLVRDGGVGRPLPSPSARSQTSGHSSGGSLMGLPVSVGDRSRPFGRQVERSAARDSRHRRWRWGVGLALVLGVGGFRVGVLAWRFFAATSGGRAGSEALHAAAPAPPTEAPANPLAPLAGNEVPAVALEGGQQQAVARKASRSTDRASATPADGAPSAPPAPIGRAAPAPEPTSTGEPVAAVPSAELGAGGSTPSEPQGPSSTGEPVAAVPSAELGARGAAPTTSRVSTSRGRGTMTISSVPRAQVVVDGRYVRYSPLFRYSVAAGDHVVTLITEDGRRTTFKVHVVADREVRKVWSFDLGDWIEE